MNARYNFPSMTTASLPSLAEELTHADDPKLREEQLKSIFVSNAEWLDSVYAEAVKCKFSSEIGKKPTYQSIYSENIPKIFDLYADDVKKFVDKNLAQIKDAGVSKVFKQVHIIEKVPVRPRNDESPSCANVKLTLLPGKKYSLEISDTSKATTVSLFKRIISEWLHREYRIELQ